LLCHSWFFFSPPPPKVNVFKGILTNRLFCGILLTTAVLQVLIVEFGSFAFQVAVGGLDAQYWGVSLVLGALSLVVQQFINVAYRLAQHYKRRRNKKRLARAGHLTREPIAAPVSERHAHQD